MAEQELEMTRSDQAQKHFIAVIPLQPWRVATADGGKGLVDKQAYELARTFVQVDDLVENKGETSWTCFPIIWLLDRFLESGDEAILTLIKSKTGDSKFDNRMIPENEDKICKLARIISETRGAEVGIDILDTDIDVIETSPDQSLPSFDMLVKNLLNRFKQGEQVYGCVTFGEKPTTFILYFVLQQLAKYGKCSVEQLIYGHYLHDNSVDDQARLVNVGQLLTLEGMVEGTMRMLGCGFDDNVTQALYGGAHE